MSLKFHRAGKEVTLYLGRSTLKDKEARKFQPSGKPQIGKYARGRIYKQENMQKGGFVWELKVTRDDITERKE